MLISLYIFKAQKLSLEIFSACYIVIFHITGKNPYCCWTLQQVSCMEMCEASLLLPAGTRCSPLAEPAFCTVHGRLVPSARKGSGLLHHWPSLICINCSAASLEARRLQFSSPGSGYNHENKRASSKYKLVAKQVLCIRELGRNKHYPSLWGCL